MVRPPDEPRRQVEGNPIRLDPQLGRGRPDPNRGAAGFRAPHRVRVVGRSRSRLSRIRTEPINEVNRDNAVSRRIFQNMHTRNRSNNFEHNSMVHRNYMEQPPQPHNVRQTRNKPRRLGLTNAEYQRSRPDAQDEANRQRTELRRLLESLTEPQGASSSNENSTRQQQAASYHVLDNQDQQPGTSGVSEKLNEEPQPGTSSSAGGCGSSSLNSVCRQDGYWRPDLDMYSSSSEEDIADIDTDRFTRRNPKRRHSNRNIVQEVKNVMRRQAEMQHKKARMTRTRNLSESSSESDNDEDVIECSQDKNRVMKCTRSNAHRKSREHRSNRDIVQEVKADMRAHAEKRRKDSRMARNRNILVNDSDVIPSKISKQNPKNGSCQEVGRDLSGGSSENDIQQANADMHAQEVLRLEEANTNEDKIHFDTNIESDNDKDVIECSQVKNEVMKCTRSNAHRKSREHHLNRDIVQEVKADMRAQAEVRRREARLARNRNLPESSTDSDSDVIPSKISKQHLKNGSCQEAGRNISGRNSENDIQQANADMHAQEVVQLEEANTNKDKAHLDTSFESDKGKWQNDGRKSWNSSCVFAEPERTFVSDHHEETIETDCRKTEGSIAFEVRETKENKVEHQHTKDHIGADTKDTNVNYVVDEFKGNDMNDRLETTGNIQAYNKQPTEHTDKKYDMEITSALNRNANPVGNLHKNGSQATSSSLSTSLSTTKRKTENATGSSLISIANTNNKNELACSSDKNVITKKMEVKMNEQTPEEEEKEREASLKKMRNMLFELLFENHMSSPQGSSPVEQWWNKGRVVLFADVFKKRNVKSSAPAHAEDDIIINQLGNTNSFFKQNDNSNNNNNNINNYNNMFVTTIQKNRNAFLEKIYPTGGNILVTKIQNNNDVGLKNNDCFESDQNVTKSLLFNDACLEGSRHVGSESCEKTICIRNDAGSTNNNSIGYKPCVTTTDKIHDAVLKNKFIRIDPCYIKSQKINNTALKNSSEQRGIMAIEEINDTCLQENISFEKYHCIMVTKVIIDASLENDDTIGGDPFAVIAQKISDAGLENNDSIRVESCVTTSEEIITAGLEKRSEPYVMINQDIDIEGLENNDSIVLTEGINIAGLDKRKSIESNPHIMTTKKINDAGLQKINLVGCDQRVMAILVNNDICFENIESIKTNPYVLKNQGNNNEEGLESRVFVGSDSCLLDIQKIIDAGLETIDPFESESYVMTINKINDTVSGSEKIDTISSNSYVTTTREIIDFFDLGSEKTVPTRSEMTNQDINDTGIGITGPINSDQRVLETREIQGTGFDKINLIEYDPYIMTFQIINDESPGVVNGKGLKKIGPNECDQRVMTKQIINDAVLENNNSVASDLCVMDNQKISEAGSENMNSNNYSLCVMTTQKIDDAGFGNFKCIGDDSNVTTTKSGSHVITTWKGALVAILSPIKCDLRVMKSQIIIEGGSQNNDSIESDFCVKVTQEIDDVGFKTYEFIRSDTCLMTTQEINDAGIENIDSIESNLCVINDAGLKKTYHITCDPCILTTQNTKDAGLEKSHPIGSDHCVMATHKINDAGLENNDYIKSELFVITAQLINDAGLEDINTIESNQLVINVAGLKKIFHNRCDPCIMTTRNKKDAGLEKSHPIRSDKYVMTTHKINDVGFDRLREQRLY